MTHTDRVGIREMRQNLSRYAGRVRAGESFVITDRGEEVARLVPATDRALATDRLVADRGATRATGGILDLLEPLPGSLPGPPTAAVLDELRDERR